MIRLVLVFFLSLSFLHASKILSYNIYDRTDRADVMLTFDTPYEGVIKQSVTKTKIIIKLEGTSIESSRVKKVSSKFLHSITITPLKNQVHIVASVPQGTKLVASKTSDAYGLRLRFVDKNQVQKNKNLTGSTTTSNNPLAALPTKKGSDMGASYYIVVGILIVGLLILFVLRKRMIANGFKPKEGNPWLFQENTNTRVAQKPKQQQKQAQKTSQEINPISIRFQKSIDNATSVVMLDFGEQAYLVLLGKSNILLDKFTDNKPTTQEDFESILKSRHQELDEFLQVENQEYKENTNASFNSSQEALQAYKERAGAISYGDA